jgi:hypothetical protein
MLMQLRKMPSSRSGLGSGVEEDGAVSLSVPTLSVPLDELC